MTFYSASIKRGHAVEFTRDRVQHYKMGDGEYGIAIDDENPDGSVDIELADNSIYRAKHIHAYGWGGWLPDELEAVWAKYNVELKDDF